MKEQWQEQLVFEDKFIAFVDVLGFENIVNAAESGNPKHLQEVLSILEESGSPATRLKLDQCGASICPNSQRLQRNLNFRATHISDCIVVSCEVSPAGIINLINHCCVFVLKLLRIGVMCRGFMTRGRISHSDSQFVGTGYQRAYGGESNVTIFKRESNERGTPFVELDSAVIEYIRSCDACVQEIFRRCVRRDGDLVALFPFQRLSHSFILGDYGGHKFNPEEEMQSVRNVRNMLLNMKQSVSSFVDRSNPSAVQKSEHYIGVLDSQLAECDRTDEFLKTFSNARFPRQPRW
jgi:hypothetical protein